MTDFVGAIVDLISGLFSVLIECLSSLGTLVFTVNEETGALSGITPFGWLACIMIGIPLATWIFGKAVGLFKQIFRK